MPTRLSVRSVVLTTLAVTMALATLGVPAHASEPPPVFDTTLSLDAAIAKTAGTNRILIVKATADWCGPCKRMDQTTWKDADVVAWVKANGLAVQLDVDDHPELAQRFRINAMPTMIAFKHGLETNRTVGYMGAQEMMIWLREVASGVAHPEHKGRRLGTGEREGVQDRLRRARQLLAEEKHQEAADEFLWLWNNMVTLDPNMRGVRRSFMATDMTKLAGVSELARVAFRAQRDETAESILEDNEALFDWIILNNVIKDEAATLTWVDQQLKTDDGRGRVLRSLFLVDDVLERSGRWDALVSLWPRPTERIEELAFWLEPERLEHFRDDPSMLAAVRSDYEKQFRTGVAQLYTAYVAVKDQSRADQTMQLARAELGGPAVILDALTHATKRGQAHPSMRRLLDDAARSPTVERERVDRLRTVLDRLLAPKGS